jgi:hypothetical protein
LRKVSKTALATVFFAIVAGSGAMALPNVVPSAHVVGGPELIHEAGFAERKAATKAWFKRKGNQTANWFNRQKNKIEKKLAD